MKPVENVREAEGLSDVVVWPSVGKRETRDYGRQDRVGAGAGASPLPRLDVSTIPPHPHSPIRPSVSFPDPPVYPDVHVRTNERLIPNEVIARIEEITAQEDGARLTDRLPKDAAQLFVDVVHEVRSRAPLLPERSVLLLYPLSTPSYFRNSASQALDLPNLPSPPRSKWLSALCRVCGRRALLPRSLQIPLCYNRLELPQYSGGFSDVWIGDYQGRRVAAKALRVYLTSDLHKIRKVGHFKHDF